MSDFLRVQGFDCHFVRISGGKWPDTPDEPDDVEITAVYESNTGNKVALDPDELDDLREAILQHIADNE